jgi:subtilisin family serine protease
MWILRLLLPLGAAPLLCAIAFAAPDGQFQAPTAAVAGTPKPTHPRPAKSTARLRTASRAAASPNDPLWDAAWGLRAAGAPAIWRPGNGSARTVVAVLDTGVDPTQPDLVGALVPGWNALTSTADTKDDFGHGTEVAGVIAARAGNRIGAAGYCPGCAIMPVKVLDSGGRGQSDRIAAGIDWATNHGADVINLSLVLTSPDATVSKAIANAVAHRVLVVASAGNDGGTQPRYPAAEPGVISVAAADPSSNIYTWSTTGRWVSVAAPGCNETGTTAHTFTEFCGTSSATAAASGLIALALSRGALPGEIRAALPPHTGASPPLLEGRALLSSALQRSLR